MKDTSRVNAMTHVVLEIAHTMYISRSRFAGIDDEYPFSKVFVYKMAF